MSVVGIVAEYNPFHNGHLYHLEQARAITGANRVIAVLSGNFVQRGEPAIVGKNARTRMALEAGVDVVLELPYLYALSSAGYFARGAVSLLDRLGVVDSIAFGAEAGICDLEGVAGVLRSEPREFRDALRANLSVGMSYPLARSRALGVLGYASEMLCGPNNILGIEYINAVRRLGSRMSVAAVERTVAHIGGREGRFASASEIRKSLWGGRADEALRYMPGFAAEVLAQAGVYHRFNNFSDIFHYIIRTTDAEDLRRIAEVTEGLEHRIAKFSRQTTCLDDIISHVKTKRYTLSKIKRCFMNIILNTGADEFARAQDRGPAYARVLGFRRASRELLARIEANSTIPLITNVKHASRFEPYARRMLEAELEATDIYALSADKHVGQAHGGREAEYRTPIITD
ncbi:MAG: nucleotidyltransferase [Defluviitaleaceae bacterium]|nr:nucleotidyltransferase [Defluviitaleaceae bacterium]